MVNTPVHSVVLPKVLFMIQVRLYKDSARTPVPAPALAEAGTVPVN
jgi:hypothetical protein